MPLPDTDLSFEPTRAAAQARLARWHPQRYARTRNHLDGAVSGLSPYVTHGVLSVREALRHLVRQHRAGYADKAVQELAWREFFQHVWRHAGDAIFADLGTPPWGGDYARSVPPDVRSGRTGVPAIDAAVRMLYTTGYLHNHARMWLASYLVHLRKVHWRAGADWMIGHLLDGDLASNHLSWQWVAGTFSSKPYLFNAENVARHAPQNGARDWLSDGSVIDQPYAALEQVARSAVRLEPAVAHGAGTAEPPLCGEPPPLPAISPALVDGRAVELVHPWALHDAPPGGASAVRLGVIHLPFHRRFPWSARRWQFVLARMRALCDGIHAGDLAQLRAALARAADVRALHTPNPGYRELLPQLAKGVPAPPALPEPGSLCRSFSKYYQRVQRDAPSLADWIERSVAHD